MKIKNPTDQDITLNFKSDDYFIAAGKTEDFPEDVANQWLTIYEFMTVETEPVKEVKENKVEKEEKVEKEVKKTTKK